MLCLSHCVCIIFVFLFVFMTQKIILISALIAFAACNNSDNTPTNTTETDNTPPIINYSTVNAFPHDTTSFTEGFLFHDGQLYESTGYDSTFASTRSLFGVVDLKTGKIQPKEIGRASCR